MFRLFILFSAVSLVLSSTVAGNEESKYNQKIAFPENFQQTYTNYLSLDRVQHPDQVVRLFANDIAMQGPGEDGRMPFGSILVAQIFDAKMDEENEIITSSLGRRIVDKISIIGVMQKEKGWGSQYPEGIRNGNWDYAAFNEDGSLADQDPIACIACHAPLTKTDFLFSYDHLIK